MCVFKSYYLIYLFLQVEQFVAVEILKFSLKLEILYKSVSKISKYKWNINHTFCWKKKSLIKFFIRNITSQQPQIVWKPDWMSVLVFSVMLVRDLLLFTSIFFSFISYISSSRPSSSIISGPRDPTQHQAGQGPQHLDLSLCLFTSFQVWQQL